MKFERVLDDLYANSENWNGWKVAKALASLLGDTMLWDDCVFTADLAKNQKSTTAILRELVFVVNYIGFQKFLTVLIQEEEIASKDCDDEDDDSFQKRKALFEQTLAALQKIEGRP
jgi:hypothetical protein